jgi:hypothetical protein
MILKATWMFLNFESTSTCQKSSLRTFYKKEKENEIKPKRTPRILMPPGRQQNLARGTNPRGKPNKTQDEHL